MPAPVRNGTMVEVEGVRQRAIVAAHDVPDDFRVVDVARPGGRRQMVDAPDRDDQQHDRGDVQTTGYLRRKHLHIYVTSLTERLVRDAASDLMYARIGGDSFR